MAQRVSASRHAVRHDIPVALRIFEGMGTPVALSCWMLLKYEEYDQLVSKDIDPLHYNSSASFADDALCVGLLSKSSALPTSYDREARALEKFREAEQLCLESNKRLEAYRHGNVPPNERVDSIVELARRKIRRLLGDGPSVRDLEYLEKSCRFGPGRTTSVKGDVTCSRKYNSQKPDCSPGLIHFWERALPDLWKRTITGFTPREYSECITVPKNAKIDRTIAAEPEMNIYLQLGIGALLKKLLRPWLNLPDQADRNRAAASLAQVLGLATLDLSMASDCVCIQLVLLLLPPRWVALLELARTPKMRVKGEIVELEKWSSMGNGYTFELETIIFHAVNLAATEIAERDGMVSEVQSLGCQALGIARSLTFGDDIILPNGAAPYLVETLNYLGFKVNPKKSFIAGRFFESCGEDYFDGVNVRPFFIKPRQDENGETLDDVRSNYVTLNSLRRYGNRRNGGCSVDSRLLPAWLKSYSCLPRLARNPVPLEAGDVGVLADLDDAQRSVNPFYRKDGWGTYVYRAYYRKPRRSARYPEGGYLATLAGQLLDNSFTGPHNGAPSGAFSEAMRGKSERPRYQTVHCLKWTDLGPWI